jgi:YD repeat-containing protein
VFAVREFRCERMRDQVTGTTYSDGTPAVTMSYDAAGRPLEVGNAVATDAYAYDDAGQLAVETQGTRDQGTRDGLIEAQSDRLIALRLRLGI